MLLVSSNLTPSAKGILMWRLLPFDVTLASTVALDAAAQAVNADAAAPAELLVVKTSKGGHDVALHDRSASAQLLGVSNNRTRSSRRWLP